MFKVEIRKPEEILLSVKFEPTDYPLVKFHFSSTVFKRKYIKAPVIEAGSDAKKEEKFLLDILVSERIINKITRGQPANFEANLRSTSERLSPSMRNIISDILCCSFSPEFTQAYLTTKVAELLIMILSAQGTQVADHNWSEQDRRAFEKIRDLLGQNLKSNYSIEELALVAGMNRTKLQQGFKNIFNKTIYTFSSDLKMTEAKALLTKQNSPSIKEIAAILGYKHVNHFSVAFKKKFDVSPSYFKKFLDMFLPVFLFTAL